MVGISLVTDSTANLPQTILDFWKVTVVPVQVVVGGRADTTRGSRSRRPALPKEVRRWTPVTTSRPSPSRFAEAYRELAAQGAEHIVSAHLSSELSGTYDAAVLGARDCEVPVTVVDSRSISMGLGFAVVAGARLAQNGGSAEEVAHEVADVASRSRVLFYVDSLEYLRRGGRIGAAQRLVGQALAVKPILHLAKGRVQPLEKVRTAAKALARLEDLTVESAGMSPCSVAVMHLDAESRAEDLAERIRHRLPDAEVLVGEVGAVIGTHVGPGMVAAVVSPVATA